MSYRVLAALLAAPGAALLLALGGLLWPHPAQAEFFADASLGYKLEPVPLDHQLAFAPESQELGRLSAAALQEGLLLYGAFRVEAGMSRFFGINTFALAEEGKVVGIEEQQLSCSSPQHLPGLTWLPSYSFEGRDVCIGLGQQKMDDEDYNWNPLVVLSFALPRDGGAVEVLAQWELPAQYSEGIYALDLVYDGVVELAVPYATGVAGNGGVDIMAVVPTGGLAAFDGSPDTDEGGSSYYSASGYLNLLDIDGDGNWELETSYPLFAPVFAYYYPSLYCFDTQSWSYVEGQARFPEFYAQADAFYRRLLEQLELALKKPGDFYNKDDAWTGGPGYSAVVDGEQQTLSPFLYASEDPAKPTLEEYNIQALRDLVAGSRPVL